MTNPLGVMVPMAFPGPGNSGSTLRGEAPGAYLLEHLRRVVDEGFGAVELTRIKDDEVRAEAAEIVDGLEVTFAGQVVQLQNEDGLVHPYGISHPDERERQRALDQLRACLPEARELGASTFALMTGRDPVLRGDGGDAEREGHRAALVRSLVELAGETDLELVLVPFDRRVAPDGLEGRFKGALLGPVDEAIEVLDRVREAGATGVGLGLDTAHLTQNREGPEELARALPHLRAVHVSNCVVDRDAPEAADRFGDLHPRFNLAGGAVGSTSLRRFAEVLRAGEYTGPVTFEVRPVAMEDPWDVITDARQAWTEAANHPLTVAAPPRGYVFAFRRFLPDTVFDRLTELRVENPDLPGERIRSRSRLDTLPTPLVILAADHPARMVTGVEDEPTRMGNRHEYLARIARVLAGSGVHGLMATPDVLEEVALLDHLAAERGHGFLDGKVLVASVNRGGLRGLEHELFDPSTAFRDLGTVADLGLDGVKYLVRIPVTEPQRMDRYAIRTVEEVSKSMDQAHALGLRVFLEPLAVERGSEGYETVEDPDATIKAVSVATGMSSTSTNVWLKLPHTPEFHRVAEACTNPILLLGGPARPEPLETVDAFVRSMGEAGNVRGALIGRTLLYPGDEDPAGTAEALVTALGSGGDVRQAARTLTDRRERDLDVFTG